VPGCKKSFKTISKGWRQTSSNYPVMSYSELQIRTLAAKPIRTLVNYPVNLTIPHAGPYHISFGKCGMVPPIRE
jgi:hypothetical protein